MKKLKLYPGHERCIAIIPKEMLGYTNVSPQEMWGYTNWPTVKDLKTATQYLPFGCQFKSDGTCKTARKHVHKGWNEWRKNEMCCCKHCYKNSGYLDLIHENDISTYNKSFINGVGFWRKNKGCLLPRELRSSTCLLYNCRPNDSTLYRSCEGIRHAIQLYERNIKKQIYKYHERKENNHE